MFKFLKIHKLPTLLISLISLLFVGAIAATTAWFEMHMDITPNVTSGIILSYFDSLDGATGDPGSATNPYVITRPVHYYNLVNLIENDYDEFDGNNTYFQFGKDLDNSGVEKFYAYGDDGKQISSTYSTSLNMNYYTNAGGASRALSPLGSSSHPFLGNIEGNNLTVDKLYVTGKGKSDIGIFGYVGTGAQISNLYFDHVTIDLNVMNPSEVNATGHSTHSSNVNFGYIAGHIHDTDNFDNVYVNNVSLTNSVSPLGASVKSNFGYFGYCDNAQLPQYGEEAYRHSWDAADVYNYFDQNYSSISGMTLKTRNTEYTASGSFSKAVSHSGSGSSENYSFNNSGSEAYSLATAGYQKGEQSYIVQYKDGNNYSSMTGASVTTTAPASQTEEGYYVYYNSSSSKWEYYSVDKTGGETVTKTFSVFTLSYHGVYNATQSTTYYLYYNSSTNLLDYTTTAPGTYANTPQYYFAFLRSVSDTGITYIEDGNGTSETYLVYTPYYQKYMYQYLNQNVGTRTSLKFGDWDTASTASVTNRFTLTGPTNANISYTVTGGDCSLSGDISNKNDSPYGREVNGQNPALSFTVTGASQSSRVVDDGYVYNHITDKSQISNGDVVTMIYLPLSSGTSYAAYPHGISATQSANNRGQAEPSFVSNSNYNQVVYSALLGEFTVEVSGSTYRFKTVIDNDDGYGYLFCPSTSSNQLRTTQYGEASSVAHTDSRTYWTLTNSTVSTSLGSYRTIQIYNNASNYTNRCIQYNHSANLFACYTTVDSGNYTSPALYKRTVTQATLYRQNAYSVTASSTSDEEIVLNEYDIYYYDNAYGAETRALFTLSPSLINGWNLNVNPTTVNVAPQSVNGWNLVTSTSGLVVGEKYILAYGTSAKVAKGYDSANSRMNSVTATFNGDKSKITATPNGAYEFILGGNVGDGYTLSCEDGKLYGTSGGVNFTGNTGTGTWSITFNNGNVIISCGITGYQLRYNTSGGYFNNYQNGANIQLYRRDSSDPQYIGDKIGNGYSPDYIDTVGSNKYYSSRMTIESTSVESLSSSNIDDRFYNTHYVDGAVIIRIPNRGSLDYGTITLTSGTNAPVFYKSDDTVTFGDVSCSPTTVGSTKTFTLYLNKYNIYQLSYCALDSSGNIIGAYNTDGTEDFMKASSTIDEFVLVIGAPSANTIELSHIDIAFSELVGNIGDFGRVGFRSAPGTAPGEIFSFTYEFASNVGSVANSVAYDSSTNTYALSFTSSVATTLYIYNYDANRAHVTVNGTPYVGPYNKINISATL
ncbi:hypothetical protein [Pseudobutyrivibrio sp.]